MFDECGVSGWCWEVFLCDWVMTWVWHPVAEHSPRTHLSTALLSEYESTQTMNPQLNIDRSWSLTFALSSSWMMSSCHLLDWCSWSCTEHSLLTWSPAPVSCDPRPWSPLTPAHKSLMESVLSQLVSGYTVNTPASVSLSTHQNIAHTQTFPSVSSDQRRTLQ